jgi:hypothetical protein
MPDVNLTLTIPNQYVSRALDALNGLADKELQMQNINGQLRDFKYDPKQGGETNKDFAERVFRVIGKALIRLYEYDEDYDRYTTDIGAVAQPSESVPQDIIT